VRWALEHQHSWYRPPIAVTAVAKVKDDPVLFADAERKSPGDRPINVRTAHVSSITILSPCHTFCNGS
jgi:hypothetical protein